MPPTSLHLFDGNICGIICALQVFRTYNASITLDTLLAETKEGTIPEKKAQYDAANKEVAILCNHQKGAFWPELFACDVGLGAGGSRVVGGGGVGGGQKTA